jgi:hypothetical protein
MKINFKHKAPTITFEHKQGRPKKTDEERADKMKKIYFTSSELEELKEAHQVSGLSFSSFIKTLVKKGLEC